MQMFSSSLKNCVRRGRILYSDPGTGQADEIQTWKGAKIETQWRSSPVEGQAVPLVGDSSCKGEQALAGSQNSPSSPCPSLLQLFAVQGSAPARQLPLLLLSPLFAVNSFPPFILPLFFFSFSIHFLLLEFYL